jgi:SAM-dependent methyltransferase
LSREQTFLKCNMEEINERGIWLTKELTDTHVFDKALSDAIIRLFPDVKTAVDIGCGNGTYTGNFINNGIDCIGFDGSPLTPDLTFRVCHIRDFSEPQNIGEYDLVLSLEVGEHIPREFEDVFLDNVCGAAKRFIVLSWAVVGQGGNGHLNERNNDYIIERIEGKGFWYLSKKTEYLREASEISYFKNTILVFAR